MNRTLSLLSILLLAVVSAVPHLDPEGPVLLDGDLLHGRRTDPRVAGVFPLSVTLPGDSFTGPETARFVHLVPTLGGDLSKGFATPGRARPHLLEFTLPDVPGEHLVELLGFSDCKTWFALHLEFWHPTLLKTTTRAAGFVRGPHGDWDKHALLPGVVSDLPGFTFYEYVKHKLTFKLVDKLLLELPSRPATLALAGKAPKLPPRVLKVVDPVVEPSEPVDLKKVVSDGVDERLVHVHPVTVWADGHHGEKLLTRFLHVVPKVGSDLTGGFKTPGLVRGHVLKFTVPDFPGEHLVELLGFSDCKTWHAFHLEFWHPGLLRTTTRAAGFVRGPHGDWVKHALFADPLSPLPGDAFHEFLLERLLRPQLKKLLPELPSHPVLFGLKVKLAPTPVSH